MLIGNLGADPEVRYMPSGDTVTNISLATSRRWKDRQSGEQREATEWHRVTFFNIGNFKLAEIAGEYLKKGSKAYVEGRIQTRKWQDNTGQDRYTTDIIADQMQMLDSRAGGTTDFDQQGSNHATPQTQQTMQPPQQGQQGQQSNQPTPTQNFQSPQQAQPLNNPSVPPQNFQPSPPTQPFNQPSQQFTPAVTPQQPLQPPPVKPEQQVATPPNLQQQPAEKSPSTAVKDDFDDDIPF